MATRRLSVGANSSELFDGVCHVINRGARDLSQGVFAVGKPGRIGARWWSRLPKSSR